MRGGGRGRGDPRPPSRRRGRYTAWAADEAVAPNPAPTAAAPLTTRSHCLLSCSFCSMPRVLGQPGGVVARHRPRRSVLLFSPRCFCSSVQPLHVWLVPRRSRRGGVSAVAAGSDDNRRKGEERWGGDGRASPPPVRSRHTGGVRSGSVGSRGSAPLAVARMSTSCFRHAYVSSVVPLPSMCGYVSAAAAGQPCASGVLGLRGAGDRGGGRGRGCAYMSARGARAPTWWCVGGRTGGGVRPSWSVTSASSAPVVGGGGGGKRRQALGDTGGGFLATPLDGPPTAPLPGGQNSSPSTLVRTTPPSRARPDSLDFSCRIAWAARPRRGGGGEGPGGGGRMPCPWRCPVAAKTPPPSRPQGSG